MKPYSLQYSPLAARHLARIERYVARASYPGTASEFVARIRARCQTLCAAPLHGTSQEHHRPGLRSVGMEGVVSILYEVKNDTVRILSIAYSGRQWERDLRR